MRLASSNAGQMPFAMPSSATNADSSTNDSADVRAREADGAHQADLLAALDDRTKGDDCERHEADAEADREEALDEQEEGCAQRLLLRDLILDGLRGDAVAGEQILDALRGLGGVSAWHETQVVTGEQRAERLLCRFLVEPEAAVSLAGPALHHADHQHLARGVRRCVGDRQWDGRKRRLTLHEVAQREAILSDVGVVDAGYGASIDHGVPRVGLERVPHVLVGGEPFGARL